MKKLALYGILCTIFCIVNKLEAKDKMDTLKPKEREIVCISMYTATGDTPELKRHSLPDSMMV